MKKIKKIILGIMIALLIFPSTLSAASATFKTTASTSKVVVGKTFTVTVKVSSAVTLGSWEYTINYDSSILSLVSGKKSVADPGDGSQKSQSYSYKFKAIKSGSSSISVKSYAAIGWDESKLSSTASGTTVKVITQSQLEASYSKDNNLKSLSVDGASVIPEFNKDVVDYTVELDSNTTSININASANDSKASVTGTGTFEVVEGENKFVITVTAENGSTKSYNLIANVIDPNPIKVKVDNTELTVVKRSVALVAPTSYTATTAKINDVEVPALTSEITKYVLVGLKDNEGTIKLYILNSDNTFTKYSELQLNELILYPIDVVENELFGYEKTKITINDEEVTAYKYSSKSNFAIISAVDTTTGKKNYYMYDIKNNTVTFYNNEEIKDLNGKLQTYLYIIYGFLAESFILFMIIIMLLNKKAKKNRQEKERIEKIKQKKEKKNIKEKKNEEKSK